MGIKIFGVFFVVGILLGCDPTVLSGKIAESAGGPAFTTADADPDMVRLVEDAEVDAVIDATPADVHPVVDAAAQPDMAEQVADVGIPDAYFPTPPDAAPDATEDVPLPDAAASPIPEVQLSRVVFHWQRGNTPLEGDVSSLHLWVQCQTQKHHSVGALGEYVDPQSQEIFLGMWYPANEGAECEVTLVVNDALAWGVLPPGTCTHSIDEGPPQDDPVVDDPQSPYFGTWSAQLD